MMSYIALFDACCVCQTYIASVTGEMLYTSTPNRHLQVTAYDGTSWCPTFMHRTLTICDGNLLHGDV